MINKTQKDWLNPKVEIGSSPIQGKGMFAKELIKKSEIVMRWGGPYIAKSEVQKPKNMARLLFNWTRIFLVWKNAVNASHTSSTTLAIPMYG